MKILREGNTSWIINKHSSNFDLLIIYLKLLKGKKEINNDIIMEYLENLNIHKYQKKMENNDKDKTSTSQVYHINNIIIQIAILLHIHYIVY